MVAEINKKAGAVGTTIKPTAGHAGYTGLSSYADLADAVAKMAAGSVPLAFVRGANPAHTMPKSAGFAAAFFGAIYAGALPVPLPLPTSFGGREAYVDQIRVQLTSCDPLMLLSPPGLHDIVKDAATGLCAAHDWDEWFSGEAPDVTLPKAKPTDIAKFNAMENTRLGQ
jgi:acyl-CoA synthetase (AMP-forming)/AMP-acid ligase II